MDDAQRSIVSYASSSVTLNKKKTFVPKQHGKAILMHKGPYKVHALHPVIFNNEDVTPKPLIPPHYPGSKEKNVSEVITEPDSFSFQSFSTQKFKTEMHMQNIEDVSFENRSLIQSIFEDMNFLSEGSMLVQGDSDLIRSISDVASVSEFTPEETDEIVLSLNETNTIYLLDLPSCTAPQNTEEGDLVEEENANYDYLTTGKGRNRKTVPAEVQTVPMLMKSRATEPAKIVMRNKYSFASVWDMYDTYLSSEEDVESETGASSVEETELEERPTVETVRMALEDKQCAKLLKNPKFLEACCVVERLLANNYYSEEQKKFKGLHIEPNPDDIKYKYELNLLWTFKNVDTQDKSVSAMEWNKQNEDLLAVGYGKFYFNDSTTGAVMIWNIKNPVQPERSYEFPSPVTTLAFSTNNPNLLAVGFYDGTLCIVNIAVRETVILAENSRIDSPSIEPIWHVSWKQGNEHYRGREYVIATFDDGRICIFSMTNTKYLKCQEIMRVAKTDGKLKGIETIKKCNSNIIPISRHVAAIVYAEHPEDPNIYFIGSNDGVVHTCSLNYLNQHIDLMVAHEGPMNSLKFSPFNPKLFATTGDDWHLRIWAEGIAQPIIETAHILQSVNDMDWSPTHSTILAEIRGSTTYVWDFQRKSYKPQSANKNIDNVKNTKVQFTKTGTSLLVGDMGGNVHVYALEHMPHPPFFQENVQYQVFKRCLITQPDILIKYKKLRKTQKQQQQQQQQQQQEEQQEQQQNS